MLLQLLLLVPLLAAVAAFSARRRDVMEGVNLAGAALTFGLAVLLAASVLQSGIVSTMGELLYADALSALVVLLMHSFIWLAPFMPWAIFGTMKRTGCLKKMCWERS